MADCLMLFLKTALSERKQCRAAAVPQTCGSEYIAAVWHQDREKKERNNSTEKEIIKRIKARKESTSTGYKIRLD